MNKLFTTIIVKYFNTIILLVTKILPFIGI